MRALLAAINCQKGDTERNFESHRAVVDEAVAKNCDIAVFPEMSLTGYLNVNRPGHTPILLQSEPVQRMCALSRESGVALLFGIVEANSDDLPLITQVYAADGKVVAAYRKRHLGEGEPGLFVPGEESVVASTGSESFGVAICADRDWPDEFEYAAASGAKVVFHPSAPGLWGRRTDEASWRQGFDWWRDTCIDIHGKRAKELEITVAVVGQAGVTDDEDFPGWAAVIGPNGLVTSELPDWKAGTLLAEL